MVRPSLREITAPISCRKWHSDRCALREVRSKIHTSHNWSKMSRRKASSLDTEAQRVVLAELLPLAECMWWFLDSMRDAGWSTLLPRIAFEESFGQGDELVEYRRVAIERAK